MLKELRLAIGFLTVLPLAPNGTVQMGPARAYFPLIGLALGAILAGLDFAARQALPPQVVGALLVAALLVLTRAIHTEGFLDTCDGLFGGYRSQRSWSRCWPVPISLASRSPSQTLNETKSVA